jgi:hypothetical protein
MICVFVLIALFLKVRLYVILHVFQVSYQSEFEIRRYSFSLKCCTQSDIYKN